MTFANLDAYLKQSEAAVVSPSSSPTTGFDALNGHLDKVSPPKFQAETKAPVSEPMQFDLSPLKTNSTALNSVVRGTLGTAERFSAAFGNMDQALAFRNMATPFAPEAPNVQLDNVGTFALESIASNVPQIGLSLGLAMIPVVGVPLALASVALPMFGESRQTILEETGIDQPIAATVPATFNTAMELIPLFSYAKKLGILPKFADTLKKTSKELADSGYVSAVKSGLAFGAQSAVTEAITESAQWASNLATVRYLKDEDILGKLAPEEKTDLINSFFGGAFGGGGFGLMAGTYASVKDMNTAKALDKELTELDALIDNIQVDEMPLAENPTDKVKQDITSLLRSFEPEDGQSILDALVMRRDQVKAALEGLNAELNQGQSPASEADYGKSLSKYLLGQVPEGDSMTRFYFQESVKGLNEYVQANDGQYVPLRPGSEGTGIRIYAPDEQSAIALNSAKEVIGNLLSNLALEVSPINGQEMTFHLTPSTSEDRTGGIYPLSSNEFVIEIDPNESKRDMAEAILHEMGHNVGNLIIASSWLQNQNEHKTLMDAYDKIVGKDQLVKMDQMRAAVPAFAPLMANRYTTAQARNNYETSFVEFIAEGFRMALSNRIADGSLNLRLEAPNIFRKMEVAFRKFFNTTKRYLGQDAESTATFQKFVDRMLLTKRQEELEARIRGITKQSIPTEVKPEQTETPKETPHLVDSPTVELLSRLRLRRQAQNLSDLYEVNMGILGDNTVGKFFRSTLTPIQVAEQADNRGWSFGQSYMDIVQQFQLMKTTVVELADTSLKSWQEDGPDSRTRIAKALYVISTKSDQLGRRLTQRELDQVFSQLSMTQRDQDKWAELDATFVNILDRMEDSLVYEQARIYNPNPQDRAAAKTFRDAYRKGTQAEQVALIEDFTGQPYLDANLEVNPLGRALADLDRSMAGMRQKNYFPRSRMGEYVVRVRSTAAGQTFENATSTKANETLGFYAFDTAAEQKAFMQELLPDATQSGVKVVGHKLDSEVYSVMGLPSGIIEQVQRNLNANPSTRLSPLQSELLNDIALQRSPGRRFLQHMTKRRGIQGYSEDAIRVYANYMSTASNHLARTEYASDLARVLSDMDNAIKNPAEDIANVNDLNVLKDYFTRHFDYLMKPDNDWATLRSIGFLWYLGFNVKSAFVNLMQTPMVTLPVLAKDIGTVKATSRITKAMSDAAKFLRGKNPLTGDEAAMIDYMLKSNLIDESLVSELAGLGEADALQRLVPGLSGKSVLNKVSWYGGALFRMGEKYNRYLASIAAYRIAREDLGQTHEDALQYTVKAVQASQFEYAKFNRPEFMRGKKSVIFLFWQYIQHATYLFFGGKGSRVAKRMWLLALMMAGIEGLPFAQLVMNTLNLLGTGAKTALGLSNPKVELQKDMRELIANIYDRPDDIMKGMSYQWGLGPFHLLSPLGVPIPNVTIEGSVGYGNPIGWFDGLLDPSIDEMDVALGKTAGAIFGPIGGMVLGVVEAVGYSKEEDNWKRWEKTLPVFMKNASQGARWAIDGEETTSNQMQVVTFETPEQRAEAALKSLGFTPTRVDQGRRQARALQQMILYYQSRKQMLLDDFAYAKFTKNREGISDVRAAVREFNKEVKEAGLPKMTIRASSLSRSMSERAKRRAMSEKGMNAPRDAIKALREMQRLYPVTGGNENEN